MMVSGVDIGEEAFLLSPRLPSPVSSRVRKDNGR